MKKEKRHALIARILALVLAIVPVLQALPAMEAKAASDKIEAMREEMKADIPSEQKSVAYANNYQSMQPEEFTYRSGTGTSTVNNGLTVYAESKGDDGFVAALNNSPYMSAGIITLNMSINNIENSTGAVDAGFVIKSSDGSKGLAIRYEKDGKWVLQAPNASGTYKVTDASEGTTLTQGESAEFEIGFYKNRLLIYMNGNEIYDGECLEEFGLGESALGQFGLYSRHGNGTFKVSDISIDGIGNEGEPVTDYFQDYEGDDVELNWGETTSEEIVDDGTGNKVLQISKNGTGDGRVVDLNSPDITNGTLSLDYKVVTKGSGFAFGFRYSDDASAFNELGVDGANTWIPESSSGWGSDLGLPEPLEGKWNNMMINFEGQNITVYLNKEKVAETSFDKYEERAGKLGLRLRRATLLIDNLRYTDAILSPEETVEYVNDFDDRVTGTWTEANTEIIAEGTNRLLHLQHTGENKVSQNTETPKLGEGTYLLKAKSTSSDVGFGVANGLVNFKNDQWVLTVDGKDYAFAGEAANTPVNAYVWNRVGIQFGSGSVVLSLNGKEAKAEGDFTLIPDVASISSKEDVYLDDFTYSEKTMDLDTAVETSDLFYEEFYETPTIPDYEGLNESEVTDGYLHGIIKAGEAAIDKKITEAANGVYQVKMHTDQPILGFVLGNTKIRVNEEGVWTAEVLSRAAVEIGKSEPAEPGKDMIVRMQVVEGVLQLSVNNILVGKAELPGYTAGAFGIWNPTEQDANVAVDAIGAELISVYTPNYETPNWEAVEGNPTIETGDTEKSAAITLPGVAIALDKDSPKLINQKASFDFKSSVGAGSDGGRYGVVLRGVDNKKYAAIETDIDGIWRVKVNGNDYNFGNTLALEKDKWYHFDLSLIDKTTTLTITDPESGEVHEMGSVTVDELKNEAGHFGARSWYAGKTVTIANVKIVEDSLLPFLNFDRETEELTKDGLTIKVDKAFPSVISYALDGKTLDGQADAVNTILLNGSKYIPQVTAEKTDDATLTYTMSIPEISVEIKATLQIQDNHVVDFRVTEIKETGDFKVRTFAMSDNYVVNTDSSMEHATYASSTSTGAWHGVSDEIVEDINDMERSGSAGTTMSMISGNGLAASIENNVMSGGNKVIMNRVKKSVVRKVGLTNGTWTYRHAQSDKTEELPWAKTVITGDINGDGVTDWQDGAVAYREYIYDRPLDADDMSNSMMYIAFNFASQANDPFLNTLDTGKVLYNYTDGFGQMILHKGYQAEGHDDDIPSYSNIGVRQGGADDFNYLINEGAKYNMHIGVHLNATEYHLDANELKYDNLTGSASGSLSGGWDWIDTSYYVDQTKDVLSGELQKRFQSLYNITNDHPEDPEDPTIDFYYIDVYTGNDYNAYKLVEFANSLGIKVGTEFSGPIEPGVNFVHWGPDLGYTNKGNSSIVSRIVKNDQDLFVGHALFKGQKIPGVTTWGDTKPDVQQGVTVFNNEVLPTKFMQHYGVMKYEEDKVTFEDGVTSARNKESGMVELRKDGKLVSTWRDTGTIVSENERHVSESLSLIPWIWDVNTNEVLTPDNGAKLYHWNPNGGQTTWELTDDFSNVKTFTLYELTQQGKVKVKDIAAVNGTITIDAEKNTPYVLYKSEAETLESAGNWGEGSAVKDFAFNSESLDGTQAWTGTENASVKVVPGHEEYTIEKEYNNAIWNRYVQIDGDGEVTQELDLSNLKGGEDYTVSVWTEVGNDAKSTLEVTIDGKTYSNYVTGQDKNHQSSFKYQNTNWQRLSVEFSVPEGVQSGTIALKSTGGTVKFDDVKSWKHTTKEEDVRHEDYVVYEDFENTSEGWGPFEYGGGSRQIAMATNQSNEHDNNAVVDRNSGEVGPVWTWVLNGQNSLKFNETSVGKSIKTNENLVKLDPQTTYTLQFKYTIEEMSGIKVAVVSRSTGNTVLEEDLQLKANSGASGKSEEEYMTFSQQFTTGNEDDYQVIFTQTRAQLKPGNKDPYSTEKYAFILDDFTIHTDSRKGALQAAYDEYSKVQNEGYTEESWEVFTDALAKAEALLKDTQASNEQYDAMITELDQAFAQLVKDETDKKELEKLLAEAKDLKADDYSEATWDKVQKAIEEAEEALKEENGMEEAAAKLQNSMNMLINVKALKAAIKEAEAVKDDGYTSGSYEALKAAIELGKKIVKEAETKQQVSDAITSIEQAEKNLVKKGDISKLKEAVAKAEKYEEDVYTSESWSVFTSALKDAKQLITEDDSTQKEIDAALETLETAMKNLVKNKIVLIDKDTGITAEYDYGVLPEGIELAVTPITKQNEQYASVKEALKEEADKFQAYEVKFMLDGKEYVVDDSISGGKVKVSIPKPESYNQDLLAVYSVSQNGTVVNVNAKQEKDVLVFEKTSASIYAVVQKAAEEEPDQKPGEGEDTPKPEKPSGSGTTDKGVKTGDAGFGNTVFIFLFAAGVVVTLLTVRRKRG